MLGVLLGQGQRLEGDRSDLEAPVLWRHPASDGALTVSGGNPADFPRALVLVVSSYT